MSSPWMKSKYTLPHMIVLSYLGFLSIVGPSLPIRPNISYYIILGDK